MQPTDPTIARLEDQIGWYDRKSGQNQRRYKVIKFAEIGAASLVAALAGLNVSHAFVALLAVLVVALEGALQLNQYHANWISYRSTAEALKHEKYLFLANAGPYAKEPGRNQLLAERIESLVSQEHAKWAATQEQETKPQVGTAG